MRLQLVGYGARKVNAIEPPKICIPKEKWDSIISRAMKFSGRNGEEVAFGLFAKRRIGKRIPNGYLGNHYQIEEIREIKLRHIKPGVWLFEKQKDRGFYPETGLRYVGSVEIQNNIDSLSSLDAYWTGREKIDIKIFVNSKGEFKGWWVNHETGEFFEVKPTIV